MNRVKQFLIAVILVSARVACADVAIVKTAGVVAFDEARNGFTSICFQNSKEFNLLEDLSNRDELLNSIRAGNFNVVFAIGTQAAALIYENFPAIPLVFAFVADPERRGFKKEQATGVALSVPVREQFAVLKSLNRRISRVGTIYTKDLNDPLISIASKAAEDANLELITSPISSNLDLQKAMTDLIGRVDALWIPPDPSLNSEEVIKYIGSKSLENKLPCVGPSDRYVRSGAIFSYSVDTVETGRIAGEMANKILKGAPTSKVPMQELQKPRVIINLKAAELLGLTIPQNLQEIAAKIYK
ncbi:ABC transporter substrate-binding protein [bacterium]|nr:ABC transporter substrate-binding protein [bacterium]MCI0605428.1 ABC transporter substrate-binding protein [bacterium]